MQYRTNAKESNVGCKQLNYSNIWDKNKNQDTRVQRMKTKQHPSAKINQSKNKSNTKKKAQGKTENYNHVRKEQFHTVNVTFSSLKSKHTRATTICSIHTHIKKHKAKQNKQNQNKSTKTRYKVYECTITPKLISYIINNCILNKCANV